MWPFSAKFGAKSRPNSCAKRRGAVAAAGQLSREEAAKLRSRAANLSQFQQALLLGNSLCPVSERAASMR